MLHAGREWNVEATRWPLSSMAEPNSAVVGGLVSNVGGGVDTLLVTSFTSCDSRSRHSFFCPEITAWRIQFQCTFEVMGFNKVIERGDTPLTQPSRWIKIFENDSVVSKSLVVKTKFRTIFPASGTFETAVEAQFPQKSSAPFSTYVQSKILWSTKFNVVGLQSLRENQATLISWGNLVREAACDQPSTKILIFFFLGTRIILSFLTS